MFNANVKVICSTGWDLRFVISPNDQWDPDSHDFQWKYKYMNYTGSASSQSSQADSSSDAAGPSSTIAEPPSSVSSNRPTWWTGEGFAEAFRERRLPHSQLVESDTDSENDVDINNDDDDGALGPEVDIESIPDVDDDVEVEANIGGDDDDELDFEADVGDNDDDLEYEADVGDDDGELEYEAGIGDDDGDELEDEADIGDDDGDELEDEADIGDDDDDAPELLDPSEYTFTVGEQPDKDVGDTLVGQYCPEAHT